MVIVNYKAGRFSNRLFHFSHFIVNSIAHDYTLIYPYFDEYAAYFEATEKNIFPKGRITLNFFGNKLTRIAVSFSSKIIFKIFKLDKVLFFRRFYGYHHTRDAFFDLNEPAFIQQAKKALLIVEGWRYRDKINFDEMHKSLLREIFTPKKIFLEKIKTNLSQCKKKDETILIGVHIRRTDYKTFENGAWYFSDTIYAEKMQAIKHIFAARNKKCTFYLCSDEPIVAQNFSGFEIIFDIQPHFISDLYTLAACDYIIGPPSTYSMWASFYGNVPLLKIFSSDEAIEIAKFGIVNPALEP